MANITDDASVIQPIFDQLRKNFKSQQTKSIQFRKSAIKNLLRGYVQMRQEFDQALNKALGYNSFMATLTTNSLFEEETKPIISNFQSWPKT